jgi:hypothetical protein
MVLSDKLIDLGLEHQLIPVAREWAFVPPMARINLVDDADVLAIIGYADQPLIKSLNSSQKRSLNVVTCRPEGAHRLRQVLDVKDTIMINPLSRKDITRLLERRLPKTSRLSLSSDDYLEAVEEYLKEQKISTPRDIIGLLSPLINGEGGFRYASTIRGLSRIARPELIKIRNDLIKVIARTPENLHRLSSIEFECLIGELFEKDGYSVEFTKRSRDGGVDIFAWKRDIAGEFLTIAQCKKYSPDNPVRVQVVREIAGSVNINSATAGALFTTSRFTSPAVEESKRLRYRLSLNDYFDIIATVARHQS